MPIAPDRAGPPIPVPELSFAGAVDRTLIHRRHADEAFLTDAARAGSDGFAAAALLPVAHPHYAGHTGPSRDRDPMLLLECARQAETYAAHAVFGVEPDARFVLRTWSAEFAVGDPLASPGPTELVITAVTRNPRLVRGKLRGLDYQLELWVAGARVGRVHMEVGYLGAAAYAVVRSRKHRGAPPSSDDLVPADGCPVAPARVGRVRATDTVLLDVEVGAGTVTARLRIPVENPSLFDHAQDHVPAMVLMEAARQLAALATRQWGGAAPDRTAMVAATGSFGAYTELNEPVELTATPAVDAGDPPGAAPAGGQAVEVVFRQAGTEIARVRVIMAAPVRMAERTGETKGATWLGARS